MNENVTEHTLQIECGSQTYNFLSRHDITARYKISLTRPCNAVFCID